MATVTEYQPDMVTARLPSLSHCHNCDLLNAVQWRKDIFKSGVKAFLIGFTECDCGSESVHYVEIISDL